MLKEVDVQVFEQYFPCGENPFISNGFLELNKNKVERIVWLIQDLDTKPEIGLALGVKDNVLLSPFSAPFGGFRFKKQNVYSHKVDEFVNSLLEYIKDKSYNEVRLVLPPDIYHLTFNSKCVNSLSRNGFTSEIPEITSWIDLEKFNGNYKQKNSREYYRQAVRNNLSFEKTNNENDWRKGFELICENRAKFGRPIFMTLNDIKNTSKLWPVDFFKVTTNDDIIVAAAIFYRCHKEIIYAVFWGDNDLGRPLRAMDFMLLNLWKYYKESGYRFVDLGISTENSEPNSGLLRFKETHEAASSLRYRFNFKLNGN